LTIFPDDENGDALRNIASQGHGLAKPRDIDFAVVFAQASAAEQFAEHFRELGYAVSVEEIDTEKDYSWDAVVVKHMVPTYERITDFENELQTVADRWDGRNAGWGFFPEPIAN
jgi:hypothetical protein